MMVEILFSSLLFLTQVSAQSNDITFAHCVVSESNACALDDMEGPTFIYPGGKTRCAFDTNIEQGTNSTYHYEVYPGNGPHRSKVLFYFQGGGGCFTDDTCDYSMQKTLFSLTGQKSFLSTPLSEAGDGIFNIENFNNPFKNWTVVQVAYCTADGFVGNRVKNGNVLDTHFNGLENTLSVWNWVKDNVPSPTQFVIAGLSAGSLGAQSWATFLLQNLDISTTKVAVLLDAYVGSLPFEGPEVFRYLNGCDSRLLLPPFLLEKCKAGNMRVVEVLQSLTASFPTVPFAFISSKMDDIERMVYCLNVHRGNLIATAMEYSTCIAQPEFLRMKYETLSSYAASQNVVSYWSNSNIHGFLNTNKMFTEDNGNDDGVSLIDWIAGLVAEDISEVKSYCTFGPRGVDTEQFCDSNIEQATYINPSSVVSDVYSAASVMTSSAASTRDFLGLLFALMLGVHFIM